MKYWLLLLCNLFSMFIYAREVPLSEAKTWAHKFFQDQAGTRSNNVQLSMIWDGEDFSSRTNSHPTFYVFNRDDQAGFVIVAGEDLVDPVIGYSFKHSFQMENLPSNVRGWLMERKQEINFIRRISKQQSIPTSKTWNGVNSGVGNVVKKIETALWDQGDPYNQQCPVDKNTGRNSVTGCTATAIAIALRARQWPDAGVGSIPSYTYNTRQGEKITMESHALGYTYNWKKMPLTLNANSDPEARKEVAQLMLDCGLMSQSEYTSAETGGYASNAAINLKNLMKYSPDLSFEEREYYSTKTWNSLIQKELNENGPVIYTGRTDNSGHAFVLDGYTDNNYYSVNWGWSGLCNGYYALSLMQPEDQGIGGDQFGDGFNHLQAAVLGMKKALPGEVAEKYPNLFLYEFNYHSTELDKYFYGLMPTIKNIKRNETFVIDGISVVNLTTGVSASIDLTVALFNKDGKLQEKVSNIIEIPDFLSNQIRFISSVNCTIHTIFGEGDYLAVAFRPHGATEWKEIRGGHQTQYRIPLLSDNFVSSDDMLILSSGVQYDNVHWGLKASTDDIKRKTIFSVNTGELCNISQQSFSGNLSVGLYSEDGVLKTTITENPLHVSTPITTGALRKYEIESCNIKTNIQKGDFLALCYQEKEGDMWKRVFPLTAVTGKIFLEEDIQETNLEKGTSFQFNKKRQTIDLSTLDDTTYELLKADESQVSTGTAKEGVIQISTAKLEKGEYKLVLKNGEQTKVLEIAL